MKYSISLLVSVLFFGHSFAYNYIGSDGKGYDINTHYLEYANFLASQDIIVNNTSELQKYRLENTITRAELIGISLKLAGIDLPDNYSCKKYYRDVSTNYPNSWACRAIEIAADNDIVTRENIYFRPNDNITKAEALGILMKAKNISYERDIQKSGYKPGTPQWQIDILEGAVKNGIILEYETYGVNAPAIRGDIFKQATNALIVTGDAIDKKYHYLISAGKVYHFGHPMPDIDAESFSLMEGDFFKTKDGVYKNFGCSVYNGCSDKSIIKIPVSRYSAKVAGYHYIIDNSSVWSCGSESCSQLVQADAENFVCLESVRVCGDLERVFYSGGSQVYPFTINSNYTYLYNSQSVPVVYLFFMFFERFESARELVSQSAISSHEKLVAKIKTGSYISGSSSENSISFYSEYESVYADITIDQETATLESIYIHE